MSDLNPQQFPWMRSDAVIAIFDALPKGSTRFVGGCVRNALWDEVVGDIDLATQLEPAAVIEALKAADIRTVPTGIDHGTVTAVIGGKPHEITSLRKDVETDGRRAVVAFTQDWAEDAQRRDLTINALYAGYDGQVFDPTGQGLDDIKARKFRFVGDAEARVQEDYLRILRFFRFLAWYGRDEKVDAASLKACRDHRAGLRKLSSERVWIEIKKLLSAPRPIRACRIMLTNDILETLLPESNNVDGLDYLLKLEAREAIAPDPMLRIMALSAREPLQMALLCKRLKMSNAETERLRGWADDSAQLSPDMAERDKLTAIYRSGKQVILDRARLRAAGAERAMDSAKWMMLADLAMGWTPPEFPISGKDLAKAGVPKGPEMGRALKALEALWVRSGFMTEKPQLLAALKLLGH
ncbi:CCA tRNA nucleotidyltransferase [Litorimonas sp. RW-G-Af-16]|uniref:CCA tRNA nucleotidyltransferase n=1 Tax=Litorimonas sp. RW-G-Af-16 TaxID=3241168 RepID=UPI00390C925B